MAQKWNSKVQFPTDSNFICRVTSEVAFGPSKSSGNPMITLELEVVSPAEVEVAGVAYNIAGVKTQMYYATTVLKDGAIDSEKTANARNRVKELFTLLGLDPETINWDNVDVKPLVGKQVYCMMSPDVIEQRKNPTLAQIQEAQKKGVRAEGEVMKHPITGKALIMYQPKVREIFGLADGASVGGSAY